MSKLLDEIRGIRNEVIRSVVTIDEGCKAKQAKKKKSKGGGKSRQRYEQWLDEVDESVEDICGMGIDILNDIPWEDYFANGLNPQEAAQLALGEAESEDEDFDPDDFDPNFDLNENDVSDDDDDDEDDDFDPDDFDPNFDLNENNVPDDDDFESAIHGLKEEIAGIKKKKFSWSKGKTSKGSDLKHLNHELKERRSLFTGVMKKTPLKPAIAENLDMPVQVVRQNKGESSFNEGLAKASSKSSFQDELMKIVNKERTKPSRNILEHARPVQPVQSVQPIHNDGMGGMNSIAGSQDLMSIAAMSVGKVVDIERKDRQTFLDQQKREQEQDEIRREQLKEESEKQAKQTSDSQEEAASVQGGDYGRWGAATSAATKAGPGLASAITKATGEKYSFESEGAARSAESGSDLWFEFTPEDKKQNIYFLNINVSGNKDDPSWKVALRKGKGLGSATMIGQEAGLKSSEIAGAIGNLKAKISNKND